VCCTVWLYVSAIPGSSGPWKSAPTFVNITVTSRPARHTAVQLLAVVRFPSQHPLSGTPVSLPLQDQSSDWISVFRRQTGRNCCIYTVSQKRRHYTLVHIFAEYWPIFFHRRTHSWNCAIKLLIKIPPHLRCVATQPCEMLKNRKTSNNLNQVSCLTKNQLIFNELHEP